MIKDNKSGEVSHVGRVVGIERVNSVRIMSDVWADLTFVLVYEPTRTQTGVGRTDHSALYKGPGSTIRRICVDNSEFPDFWNDNYDERWEYEVDATGEAAAAYQGYLRAREYKKLSEEYNRQQMAGLDERRRVRDGRTVRVVRGRKVPIGTEGVIFWMRDTAYGIKVGIGLPNDDGSYDMEKREGRYGKTYESYKNVAWTYGKNVKVIDRIGGRVL